MSQTLVFTPCGPMYIPEPEFAPFSAEIERHQSLVQTRMTAILLKIQSLTDRLAELRVSQNDDLQFQSCFRAFQAANQQKDQIAQEQTRLDTAQKILQEALPLKQKQIELDQTIQNLGRLITEKSQQKAIIQMEIKNLRVLECQVRDLQALSDKLTIEIVTSEKA
ncbi:MAG: hypothetical protein LLG04_07515 [Parachlamydia sp.]|nr:hypothetical protein [Parachlamydia sp.]